MTAIATPDIVLAVPPWLRSLSEYGTREIAGPKHNAEIVQWMDDYTTLPAALLADETAWCSVFANMAMQQNGYRGTRSAAARSWLTYGVPLDQPRLGAIMVFWRGSPTGVQGHVAFHIADHEDKGLVWVYGGNQGNRARMAEYPRAQLLPGGVRWPSVADRLAA